MPLPILLVGAVVSGGVTVAVRHRHRQEDAAHAAIAAAHDAGSAIYPTAIRLSERRSALRTELTALRDTQYRLATQDLVLFNDLMHQIKNLDAAGLAPLPPARVPAAPSESETLRWLLDPAPPAATPLTVMGGLRLTPESQAVLADPRAADADVAELQAVSAVLRGALRLVSAWRAEVSRVDSAFQLMLADLSLLLEQEQNYHRLAEHRLPGMRVGPRRLLSTSHACASLLHTMVSHPLLDRQGSLSIQAPQLLDRCRTLRQRALRGLEEALFAARLSHTPRAGALIG